MLVNAIVVNLRLTNLITYIMDAMSYEAIVRFANGDCGRYGVAGADADIYRGFERAGAYYNERMANPNVHPNNLAELTLKYGIAIGEISAYLNDSIERIENLFEGRLTEEQSQVLSSSTSALLEPTSEAIVTVIEKVSDLIPALREL